MGCLWAWAVDNAPDGDLTGFDVEEIAEEADWGDDAVEFINALVNAGKTNEDGTRGHGFLDRMSDGRLLIHDWWTQGGGKLIAIRERKAYRMWANRKFGSDAQDTPALYEQWISTARREHNNPVPYEFISWSGDSGDAETPPSENVSPQNDTVSERVNIEQSRAEQRSVAKSKQSREESTRGEPADIDEPVADLVKASLARGEPVQPCLPAMPIGNALLAGHDPPDGASSLPFVLPDRTSSPERYVEAVLRLNPHWKAELSRRYVARKSSIKRGNDWPFKAGVLASWLAGASDAPPMPKPPDTKPKPPPLTPEQIADDECRAREAKEQALARVKSLSAATAGSS